MKFVDNNVFAEVGLIENAAQTCASIVAKSFYIDENNIEKKGVEVIGFISGIKKISVFLEKDEIYFQLVIKTNTSRK